MFQAQLDYLATTPTYTVGDHCKLLMSMAEKAGVTGWKSALRTAAQQAEIDEQVGAVDSRRLHVLVLVLAGLKSRAVVAL